jgi:succinyl-CoA:acetate CoA-transferase
VVPPALAKQAAAYNAKNPGKQFRIGLLTGASTAPELDGALSEIDAVSIRMPYNGDPIARKRINAGTQDYTDVHLSHSGPQVEMGLYGKVDTAVVEVTAIREDGLLIPCSSVGNNQTYLDVADKVILEVNARHKMEFEGMHDIYATGLPPHRKPIPIVGPNDRIGEKYMRVDPKKVRRRAAGRSSMACVDLRRAVLLCAAFCQTRPFTDTSQPTHPILAAPPHAQVVAVVETNAPDRNNVFAPPDDDSNKIAGFILDFFASEVRAGRLPKDLLPLQSGVGNVANAVMAGLNNGPFKNLTAYTEVLQDGMLELLKSGTMKTASSTALSLSVPALAELEASMADMRNRIVLRPQEISNHPELVRRMGLIAMNAMIECDIYGNVRGGGRRRRRRRRRRAPERRW